VQEGVFIPRRKDVSSISMKALLRMTGYEAREELMALDIPVAFYANQWTAKD